MTKQIKRATHEVIFDELNSLEEYYQPMQIDTGSKAQRTELARLLTDAFLFFFSAYETNRQYNRMLGKDFYKMLLSDKVSDAVTNVTGIDSYMSRHITQMADEVVNTTFKHTQTDEKPGDSPKKSVKSNDASTQAKTSVYESYDSDSNSTPASLIYNPLGASESPYTSQLSDAPTLPTSEDAGYGYGYWLSYDRAEDIAKNEANTFLNYTDYVSAKDRGYTKKRWLTMLDDKVRQTHSEVEGDTIGIDETFQVGNSQMRFPHDLESSPDPQEVIGCRCAVEYLK